MKKKLDKFWSIVDRVFEAAGFDFPQASVQLEKLLLPLSSEQLQQFEDAFCRVYATTNIWDLWYVAYIIRGGCSDDAFTDFRKSLIYIGKENFETVMLHPDAIGDFDFDANELFYEGLQYIPSDVHEQKFATSLPPSKISFEETTGLQINWNDPNTLQSRFPKVFRKYW